MQAKADEMFNSVTHSISAARWMLYLLSDS